MILCAPYVLAADNQIIPDGAVRVDRGTIVEVGPAAQLTGPATQVTGPARTDLGQSLLLPGFVNAHTHLELTHLAGRIPPKADFVDWIRRLVDAMRDADDDSAVTLDSVRRGRELSLSAGVTTIGDITRLPALTRPVLAEGPLRTLSFGEVIAIGRLRNRLNERLTAAADACTVSEFLQIGISPHAPYTLEPDGLRACVARAVACGLRMCIHLAETANEAEFTADLTGPIRTFFERHHIWDRQVPCPGLSPVEYAADTGLLGPDALLAHANYVTDRDIDRIAASGAHVAYCPRTHAAFGHPPHPFRRMLDRGVNVCVGTDSLASNPSLSVLEELRFLRRNDPDLPPALLIEMGTARAARALGMSTSVGRIAPGLRADLTAIPLDPDGPSDPMENVLQGNADPTCTCVAGRWHGTPPPP
ncbi:MAG TPA: amidohydrolase family protein [Phycisphaerae bacterium]|nr:amidohydrolase family protein [Phycisphaerae bacterium]